MLSVGPINRSVIIPGKTLIKLMPNDLLRSVLDCLAKEDCSREGKLSIIEGFEVRCLRAAIKLFSESLDKRKHRFCEVSRLQFPKAQRKRAGMLQPVRYVWILIL